MDQSQQIATEHRGNAAHVHNSAAEHRGQEDHLTGHERSRQEHEHANREFGRHEEKHAPSPGHAPQENSDAPTEQEIAARAYLLWKERGSPEGSPEEDWRRALEQLRSKS